MPTARSSPISRVRSNTESMGEFTIPVRAMTKASARLARQARILVGHPKISPVWIGRLRFQSRVEAGAVREFTAVLALKPLDKASAEYELAQAYFADGDKD